MANPVNVTFGSAFEARLMPGEFDGDKKNAPVWIGKMVSFWEDKRCADVALKGVGDATQLENARKMIRACLKDEIYQSYFLKPNDAKEFQVAWRRFEDVYLGARPFRLYQVLVKLVTEKQVDKSVEHYMTRKSAQMTEIQRILNSETISIEPLVVLLSMFGSDSKLRAAEQLHGLKTVPSFIDAHAYIQHREAMMDLQRAQEAEPNSVAMQALQLRVEQAEARAKAVEDQLVAAQAVAMAANRPPPRVLTKDQKEWSRQKLCFKFMETGKCNRRNCNFGHPEKEAKLAVVDEFDFFSGKAVVGLSAGSKYAIDSAANVSQSSDSSSLSDPRPLVRPVVIKTVGGKMHATEGGDLKLSLGGEPLTLSNILVVPGGENLLAINDIVDAGLTVSFNKTGCAIAREGGSTVEVIPRASNGLYYVSSGVNLKACLSSTPITASVGDPRTLYSFSRPLTAEVWHRRFMHRSWTSMEKLIRGSLVEGFTLSMADVATAKAAGICGGCASAKLTRNVARPLPSSQPHSLLQVGEMLHSDLMGPFPIGYQKVRYVATVIDDVSRRAFVWLLRDKDELTDVYRQTVALVATHTGRKLKYFQSDRGGEYIGDSLRQELKAAGVVHRRSHTEQKEQNGVAERFNRTLLESSNATLNESGVSEYYRGECIKAAAVVYNMMPHSSTTQTPWEAFYGVKPDVGILRAWGCQAWVRLTDRERGGGKSPVVAVEGVLVGYEIHPGITSNGYRILVGNKIHSSKDVIFDELRYPMASLSSPVVSPPIWSDDEDQLGVQQPLQDDESGVTEEAEEEAVEEVGQTSHYERHGHLLVMVGGQKLTRRSKKALCSIGSVIEEKMTLGWNPGQSGRCLRPLGSSSHGAQRQQQWM